MGEAHLMYSRIFTQDGEGRTSRAFELYHVFDLGAFSDGTRPDRFLIDPSLAVGFPLKYQAHSTLPGLVAIRRQVLGLIDNNSLYAGVEYGRAQNSGTSSQTRMETFVEGLTLPVYRKATLDDGTTYYEEARPEVVIERPKIRRIERRFHFGASDYADFVNGAIISNLGALYYFSYPSPGGPFSVPFILVGGGAWNDVSTVVSEYRFETTSFVSEKGVGEPGLLNDVAIPALDYLQVYSVTQASPGAVPVITPVEEQDVSYRLGGTLPGL